MNETKHTIIEAMEAVKYSVIDNCRSRAANSYCEAIESVELIIAQRDKLLEALRNLTQESEYLIGRMDAYKILDWMTIHNWKMRVSEGRAAIAAAEPGREG